MNDTKKKAWQSEGVKTSGTPTLEELTQTPGFPSEEFLYAGPVAFIECVEKIPCNPCETACPRGAITIGDNITELPMLDAGKCTGCGLCLPSCPGLAIYVKDYTFEQDRASIIFPFEYLPLPKKGDIVEMVDRFGETLCEGEILMVNTSSRNDQTSLIKAAFDKRHFIGVVSMKRLVT